MEAEERPAKMRKLSHGGGADGTATLDQDHKLEDHASQKRVEGDDHEAQDAPLQPVDDVTGSTAHDGPEDASQDDDDSLPPPEETAPLAISDAVSQPGDPPLSKNQQKKLRKKQEWEAKREERKIVRKEKLVAKRERKREERRQQQSDEPPPPVKKPKAAKPLTLPVTFLIDCDFDDLMRDNERISLAAQITRSYSDNKNSLFRANLAVCSFNGKLRERFDNILTHYKGWRGVHFLEEDFVEAAEKAKEWMSPIGKTTPKMAGSAFAHLDDLDPIAQAELQNEGEVIYLTSESDYTLTELKPYSTYIIGGLVDKNREKGICYKRARAAGVKTARLPIGEFMDMTSRKVLATNHVNEIMLKWLECRDWGEAFMKVIPKRKGGKLKGDKDEVGDEDVEIDGDVHGRDENLEAGDNSNGADGRGAMGESEAGSSDAMNPAQPVPDPQTATAGASNGVP